MDKKSTESMPSVPVMIDDGVYIAHDQMGQASGLFKTQSCSEILPDIPILFTDGQSKGELFRGKPIVSMERFNERFLGCTRGLFANWDKNDWANIVVAGGAVLHCLTPGTSKPSPNSDIDLFMYGMNESDARVKIDQLYQKLSSSKCINDTSQTIVVLRTVHTLTFVCPYPIPHTQIILRLHAEKQEIIKAFDVDCCGVMFDGANVMVTSRAIRALNSQCNVATPERRSWTYESRLLKYVKRGYSIAVPGLRVNEVQLKKPYKLSKYRCRLDKEDPRYLASSYEKVDLGWEWKFGDNGYGGYYGNDDDNELPTMFDYFESKCLRKLLIANIAGRQVFQKESKRSKFIYQSRSTMEIAMYMMSLGEHYGPSAPDVPGASLYAVSGTGPAEFLHAAKGQQGYLKFEVGGIPTGVAEVGGTDEWDADCYLPLTLPGEEDDKKN